MDGHTSSVRLFGSDEANTDERERRRRMRGPLCPGENERFYRALMLHCHCNCCRQGRDVLLIGTGLRQRLHRWRRVFLRCLAASLIYTTCRLAGFLSRDIRENTRPR